MTIIRDGTAASFIVVWKNGKWKQTAKPGKYEQEADFLVTIPIREGVPYVYAEAELAAAAMLSKAFSENELDD